MSLTRAAVNDALAAPALFGPPHRGRDDDRAPRARRRPPALASEKASLTLLDRFIDPDRGSADQTPILGPLLVRFYGYRCRRLQTGAEALELGLVDEHPPRLRALVAADDPAPLEHVDQPAGPRVADPQPALEQRDRRGLGRDDDLDRAVEQRILVRVELAVSSASPSSAKTSRQLEEALVDLLLALASVCSTTSAISSSVTYAPWTRCRREVPSGLKSMSPWPSSALGAVRVEDHARVGLRRDGEGDPRRDVRLDHPGDHVDRRPLRREHEVDADGARLLREPDDRVLDRPAALTIIRSASSSMTTSRYGSSSSRRACRKARFASGRLRARTGARRS